MKNIILVIITMLFSNFLFGYEIYAITTTAHLGPCKVYTTFFWSDNDTPDNKKDDKLLGSDVIIDCPPDSPTVPIPYFNPDQIIIDPFIGLNDLDNIEKYDSKKGITYGEYNRNKQSLLKEIENMEKIKYDDHEAIKYIKTVKDKDK